MNKINQPGSKNLTVLMAIVYVTWVIANSALIIAVENCLLKPSYLDVVSYLAPAVIGIFVFGVTLWSNVTTPLKVMCGLAWALGGGFAFAYTLLQDKGLICSFTS